jgi:hypothetical protein
VSILSSSASKDFWLFVLFYFIVAAVCSADGQISMYSEGKTRLCLRCYRERRNKDDSRSGAWWYMPIIPPPRRLRKETANLRPVWDIQDKV